MSFWYRKMELARRFSIFYAASLVSGAFGGLLGKYWPELRKLNVDWLAGAILSGLNGTKGLPAWKWLFLSQSRTMFLSRVVCWLLPPVEGLITIGFSIFAVCVGSYLCLHPSHLLKTCVCSFILPDFPATTKWLSQEERDYAVARLAADHNIDDERDDHIGHMRSLLMAVKDWRTWLFCFGQTTCTAAGTITYFIPTLMQALGYTGTKSQFVCSISLVASQPADQIHRWPCQSVSSRPPSFVDTVSQMLWRS